MERTNNYFNFIYPKNIFISINKNLNKYFCNSIPNSYTANIVKMQKQPEKIKYTEDSKMDIKLPPLKINKL